MPGRGNLETLCAETYRRHAHAHTARAYHTHSLQKQPPGRRQGSGAVAGGMVRFSAYARIGDMKSR
jgi:hypothetical protein